MADKKTEVLRIAAIKKAMKFETDKTILAIDPATKLGWALGFDDKGLENFSNKKGEHNGHKWEKIERWLRGMLVQAYGKIHIIVSEMPVVSHLGATIHHAKICGIIEKFCANNSIQYLEVSPTKLKKWATGVGNAKKDKMIEAAQKYLKTDATDDNIIDALWIFYYTKHLLRNEDI